MDTKTGNKRAQVFLRGGGLSGGVYKKFIPLLLLLFFNLILFPKNSPIFPLKVYVTVRHSLWFDYGPFLTKLFKNVFEF